MLHCPTVLLFYCSKRQHTHTHTRSCPSGPLLPITLAYCSTVLLFYCSTVPNANTHTHTHTHTRPCPSGPLLPTTVRRHAAATPPRRAPGRLPPASATNEADERGSEPGAAHTTRPDRPGQLGQRNAARVAPLVDGVASSDVARAAHARRRSDVTAATCLPGCPSRSGWTQNPSRTRESGVGRPSSRDRRFGPRCRRVEPPALRFEAL